MAEKYKKAFYNIMLVLTWVVYPPIHLVLEPKLGIVTSAFSLIPVMLTGWRLGRLGGVVSGFMILVTHIGLKLFTTGSLTSLFTVSEYIGSAIMLMLGFASGYMGQILKNLNIEIHERGLLENTLRTKNIELENISKMN